MQELLGSRGTVFSLSKRPKRDRLFYKGGELAYMNRSEYFLRYGVRWKFRPERGGGGVEQYSDKRGKSIFFLIGCADVGGGAERGVRFRNQS